MPREQVPRRESADDGFRARVPHHHGVIDVRGRRLKWYTMSATGEPVGRPLQQAAQDHLRQALTEDPSRGVGFAVLHVGDEAVWLLCDTWHADIVHHRLWRAGLDRPADLSPVAAGGPTACVHELVVMAHERNSYVTHVLRPATPDPDAYLDDPHGAQDGRRRAVLVAFDAAWRRRDVPALMALMTGDPTYAASTGPGPGEVHRGVAAVRDAFRAVMEQEAATAHPGGPSPLRPEDIWLEGDRALTRWQYATATPGGGAAVVHGVDLWELDGTRIRSKDAFRKAWPG